jgi:hypothetical protein
VPGPNAVIVGEGTIGVGSGNVYGFKNVVVNHVSPSDEYFIPPFPVATKFVGEKVSRLAFTVVPY